MDTLRLNHLVSASGDKRNRYVRGRDGAMLTPFLKNSDNEIVFMVNELENPPTARRLEVYFVTGYKTDAIYFEPAYVEQYLSIEVDRDGNINDLTVNDLIEFDNTGDHVDLLHALDVLYKIRLI